MRGGKRRYKERNGDSSTTCGQMGGGQQWRGGHGSLGWGKEDSAAAGDAEVPE